VEEEGLLVIKRHFVRCHSYTHVRDQVTGGLPLQLEHTVAAHCSTRCGHPRPGVHRGRVSTEAGCPPCTPEASPGACVQVTVLCWHHGRTHRVHTSCSKHLIYKPAVSCCTKLCLLSFFLPPPPPARLDLLPRPLVERTGQLFRVCHRFFGPGCLKLLGF